MTITVLVVLTIVSVLALSLYNKVKDFFLVKRQESLVKEDQALESVQKDLEQDIAKTKKEIIIGPPGRVLTTDEILDFWNKKGLK